MHVLYVMQLSGNFFAMILFHCQKKLIPIWKEMEQKLKNQKKFVPIRKEMEQKFHYQKKLIPIWKEMEQTLQCHLGALSEYEIFDQLSCFVIVFSIFYKVCSCLVLGWYNAKPLQTRFRVQSHWSSISCPTCFLLERLFEDNFQIQNST